LFIIIIGRERNADFSATNGSTFSVGIVFKILTPFISGSCAHGRSVDFFVYSIGQKDAFPSVECLNLDQAVSGACTGTATAFMGDDTRFE